jgi:hypothetical protein
MEEEKPTHGADGGAVYQQPKAKLMDGPML